MTIQDQIAALLAEAEPLRLLDEREAESQGLGRIVDKINALRALEATEKHDAFIADVKAPLVVEPSVEHEKRKPGRPKKAEAA